MYMEDEKIEMERKSDLDKSQVTTCFYLHIINTYTSIHKPQVHIHNIMIMLSKVVFPHDHLAVVRETSRALFLPARGCRVVLIQRLEHGAHLNPHSLGDVDSISPATSQHLIIGGREGER